MNLKPTFSVRLTLWYSLMLLLAVGIFGTMSYVFIARQLYEEQYVMLSENAEQISEVIRFRNGTLDISFLISEADALNLNEQGVFFEIWNSESERIFHARNAPRLLRNPPPAKDVAERLQLHDDSGFLFNVLTIPVFVTQQGDNRKTLHIRVGQSILYVEKILRRIRHLLYILIPGVLVFASWGGWYLARRALDPVAAITKSARELSLRHLELQVPESMPDDELGQLVRTFNSMIQRIKIGVDRINQFTADVSHELRTPLTIMRGEIEVALRRSRSVEEYQQILSSALQELSYMEQMINDLLLLSRADSGEFILQLENVKMAPFIADVLEQFQKLSPAQQIQFDVPDACQDVVCSIDRDKIKRVMLNILDNAVKYTPQGGSIMLTLDRQDMLVLIRCSDKGIGISKDDLPRVFDRFYRADKSRSRAQHSSGLGLSICKWILEAHDGRIELESELNRGTTVNIWLPVAEK